MRLSISMPDDLHKQILVSAAQQQLKTLKGVSVSDFIRSAIEEKLNMHTNEGDAKGNNISDAPASVHNSTNNDGAQVKKRRKSKITPELHDKFLRMQNNGATAREIANALDCSVATISGLRKRLKDSIIPDATTPVFNSVSDSVASSRNDRTSDSPLSNNGRKRKITTAIYNKFLSMQANGSSREEIMNALKCSKEIVSLMDVGIDCFPI